MSAWVPLTYREEPQDLVWVNLDQVISIEDTQAGTFLRFAHAAGRQGLLVWGVLESAVQICDMADDVDCIATGAGGRRRRSEVV